MSPLSPELESALARFSGLPDATADQVTQLREALTSDAALLSQYNQLAAEGKLNGFGLPQHSEPNFIGTYDKAAGIVILPAQVLQAPWTSSSSGLSAALRVQEMSARYAHDDWTDAAGVTQPVNQDMVDNLQSY